MPCEKSYLGDFETMSNLRLNRLWRASDRVCRIRIKRTRGDDHEDIRHHGWTNRPSNQCRDLPAVTLLSGGQRDLPKRKTSRCSTSSQEKSPPLMGCHPVLQAIRRHKLGLVIDR